MAGQTWEQPADFARVLHDELKPPYKIPDEDRIATLAIRLALGIGIVIGIGIGILIGLICVLIFWGA